MTERSDGALDRLFGPEDKTFVNSERRANGSYSLLAENKLDAVLEAIRISQEALLGHEDTVADETEEEAC